jgi:magnesium-transporting ATPase (P-type)
MATGDNVLTAISVGRECNLIEPDHEVFLGDLVYKKTGKNVMQWRSTRGEQSGKKLNVGTLLIDDGRESNQVTPL